MEDKKIIKIFQSIKRISFGSLICSGYPEELLEKDFSTCKINEANINALKNFIWSSFNKLISLFTRDFQRQAQIYWSVAIFYYKYGRGKVIWNCKKFSSDCRIHHFKSDPSTIFTYEANILVPPESCSAYL